MTTFKKDRDYGGIYEGTMGVYLTPQSNKIAVRPLEGGKWSTANAKECLQFMHAKAKELKTTISAHIPSVSLSGQAITPDMCTEVTFRYKNFFSKGNDTTKPDSVSYYISATPPTAKRATKKATKATEWLD